MSWSAASVVVLLVALGARIHVNSFTLVQERKHRLLRRSFQLPMPTLSSIPLSAPSPTANRAPSMSTAKLIESTAPSQVGFAPLDDLSQEKIQELYEARSRLSSQETDRHPIDSSQIFKTSSRRIPRQQPVTNMLQCAAPYIAKHYHQTFVIHIPGDILEDAPRAERLFSDMALTWLLGMKLVLVVSCRYQQETCDLSEGYLDADHGHSSAHECQNVLKTTDSHMMRLIEEDAGYLRTEVERRLNRYLSIHSSASYSGNFEGYVVSGSNYYTASRFGRHNSGTADSRGSVPYDFEYTGYTSEINTEHVSNVLQRDDIVLLSTVGLTKDGELVNVNGYHLAASVANAMGAHKLIYMANEGSILTSAGSQQDSSIPLCDLSLPFTKDILNHHKVQVFPTGFAAFNLAQNQLPSFAVELLLHLGWSTWALQQNMGSKNYKEGGVQRAHIVNRADGGLLEELFTKEDGLNTCLYRDGDFVSEFDLDRQQAAVSSEASRRRRQQEENDWNSFFGMMSSESSKSTLWASRLHQEKIHT